MGKYDNEYKGYYRRVNNNPNIRGKTFNGFDDDIGGYGVNYNKDNKSITEYFFKALVGTTICSICLASTVLGGKYLLGEKGDVFYSSIKLTIEENGSHGKKINELVEIISKETNNLLVKNKLGKSFVNKANKVGDSTIGDNEEELQLENKAITVTSFKLNDNSVESTTLGDLKYKSEKPIKSYKSIDKSDECVIFNGAEGDITSILDGEIVEISKKNNEYIIEINHGNNLKVFYYGLGEIKIKKGDNIKRGEVLITLNNDSTVKVKIEENNKVINLGSYLEL